MAVMARETWSDERLDELNNRVDEGFKETRTEFRAVRSEMQQEFQAVRAEMKDQTRLLIQLFGGMFATFVVGFIGIVATILTQT
jgi:hypothetical protein